MKHTHYIYMAAAMLALATVNTACMDSGWDDEQPAYSTPFGNNSLQATNIVSIAELKATYKDVIFAQTDTYKQITDDIQLLVRVTGNDLGGNIYKQLIVEDKSGAIIISVNQGGMSGFLAEGAQVLISLKDLYIGGYRKMPQIGGVYNGGIGRMQRDIFNAHFKIVGEPMPEVLHTMTFDPDMDMEANCGRLVTLTGVTFNAANGTATLADPNDVTGGATNRQVKLNGQTTSKKVYVRTSTYADFAAMVMPFDAVNKRPLPCTITGIASRYNNDWQILIRKSGDIVVE